MYKILLFILLVFIGCRENIEIVQMEFIPVIELEKFLILSPKFGEIWFTGENYEIKWILSSRSKNVRLELYRKNTLKKIIAFKTPNDGNYNYFVPTDLASSNLYKIKIINFDDSTEYSFSDYFSIR